VTEIVATFDTLMDQAKGAASSYMYEARSAIDKAFGEGYAAANPALVAAFMQTAVADFGAAATAKVIGSALEEIAESLRAIASSR